MPHKAVHDTSVDFIINPDTRTIVSQSQTKPTLVKNDHNSEEFLFEIPRYIEGHDMMETNRIEVHYINISSANREQIIGVYEVENLKVSETNEDTLTFSWIVSMNSTKYAGPLSFVIRFACLNDTEIDYAWNTTPNTDVVVSDSIYNGEAVIEEYYDLLEQWEKKIGVGVSDVEQTVRSEDPGGVNVITLILTDGNRHSFEVRNGTTPARGVDYWTDADKQEIINSILGVIPVAEEASF